jgi:hypothetical protein
MALLFLLPRFLWHACPRQGGVNIRRLVKGIKENTEKDKGSKDDTDKGKGTKDDTDKGKGTKDDTDISKGIKVAQETLKLYLDTQHQSDKIVCCAYPCPKCSFGYTLAYFSIKLLYVINTIGQFFLLNNFLSFEFTSYGVEALRKMYNGEDWFESPTFPRVTMCDFMVRRLGSNQHWYSVQCTLPFNMYNEKIFLGIWFWLIILTIFNILSIISWIISLSQGRRLAAINRYLTISRPREEESRIFTKENTMNLLRYLKIDGYLIFRLIGRNTDEIAAGKIMRYLYNASERSRRFLSSNV